MIKTLNPMFEMAIFRALEVLERGSMVDGHIYRHSIDSHWLGTGCGICIAREWAVQIGDGILEISDAGRAELARRRFVDATRMPDGVVPTSYKPGMIRAPDPRNQVLTRGMV